jgi:hypothetical protein
MSADHDEPSDGASPYEKLTRLAKARGVPITDLLALARQNDPFLCGTPTQLRAAEWFANLYAAGRFGQGVHLRRIHYYAVSVEAVLPNGTPYVNTVECASVLAEASKAGRYLGLVDIAAFDDRRNPPAEVYEAKRDNAYCWVSGREPEIEASIGDMPGLPRISVSPPAVVQPYALEVWCEKSTMNDVLLPLCSHLEATLVTGLGELSITACQKFVMRVQRDKRPTRILYVSDFDPAGRSMPVAVARKVEFLIQEMGLDIALLPVVLTAEQVERYRLPRVPIKESELRRARFEAIHGAGATELDALEALHRGELRKILMVAAAPYRDDEIERQVRRAWADLRVRALRATDAVHEQHAAEIEDARREWHAIGAAIDQWRDKHANTWRGIADALAPESVAILETSYPMPCAPGDQTPPMFHSLREYEEQLAAYRKFREGRS